MNLIVETISQLNGNYYEISYRKNDIIDTYPPKNGSVRANMHIRVTGYRNPDRETRQE